MDKIIEKWDEILNTVNRSTKSVMSLSIPGFVP